MNLAPRQLGRIVGSLAAVLVAGAITTAEQPPAAPAASPAAVATKGAAAIEVPGPPASTRARLFAALRFELRPARTTVVRAVRSGLISTLPIRPGQRVHAFATVAEIDSRRERLLLQKMMARKRAAEIRAAQGQGSAAADRAAALVEAATVDETLARREVQARTVKAPHSGLVSRVFVTPGQYVRPGTPLFEVLDDTRLAFTVPVARGATEMGSTVTARFGTSQPVQGTVVAEQPLNRAAGGAREVGERGHGNSACQLARAGQLTGIENGSHFGFKVTADALASRHELHVLGDAIDPLESLKIVEVSDKDFMKMMRTVDNNWSTRLAEPAPGEVHIFLNHGRRGCQDLRLLSMDAGHEDYLVPEASSPLAKTWRAKGSKEWVGAFVPHAP